MRNLIVICLLGVPLVSLATQRSIPLGESLNSLKKLLESDSNLRTDFINRTDVPDHFPVKPERHNEDDYRITEINDCTITLLHRSTSVDQNYDGAQTITKALVNLSNLRFEPKVTVEGYGKGWEPPSRWVVSDAIVDNKTPIPTEIERSAFPGLKRSEKSQSDLLKIEFLDSASAEQARTLLLKAIMTCARRKTQR